MAPRSPAPSPRGRWATVVSVVLCCFVGQSFARFSFGLLLPAMKNDLRISYGIAGWLGTINLAGYLVGTVVTSVASLRVPAHRLVQIGVVTSGVGLGVLATTRSTPVLLLGMALGGLGGAAAWVPAPAVVASVFPPERRGFAMGICSGGIGMGIVVAVVLTNVARGISGNDELWRPIWVIEAAVSVVAVLVAFAVLRPVPIQPGSLPRLSVLRRVPRWWAPTAAYTCFGLGYVLFATYVVAALEQDHGFGVGHASRVFALLGAGNAVGALSVGRLSDRIGRRTTMAASFAGAGTACAVVMIGVEPLVSIVTFVFGMSMAGAVVSIAAYLGDHVRPQEFGAAFGVVTAAFGVAQTIGPRLGGAMADHAGNFRGVFVLAALVWGLGAALALGLPTRRR